MLGFFFRRGPRWRSMGVEQKLAELVRIDSRSSNSNGALIDYAAARCVTLGLRSRVTKYADERGVEKFQLVAFAPEETEDVELALVGHTDTVPFDAAWSEALALTERDGKLYGRGACDTKGFIAAAITAIEETDVRALRRPLALVLTADEEVGLVGAKKLAESKPFRARHAVVGEPTSLQPMRAGKGYCLADVTVGGRQGRSAHSSEER